MHMCIEFAKYRELGNFAVSMGRPQATMLQLQGALPLDPAGGSAPYPHNYRLAFRAHHVSPNFHDSPPQVLGGWIIKTLAIPRLHSMQRGKNGIGITFKCHW